MRNYKEYPTNTPAGRIVTKFGGPRQLCEAMAGVGHPIDISAVYRWMYPRDLGGTGGLIPTARIAYVQLAARYWGVILNAEDFLA